VDSFEFFYAKMVTLMCLGMDSNVGFLQRILINMEKEGPNKPKSRCLHKALKTKGNFANTKDHLSLKFEYGLSLSN
jgi:hypothetical protein